MPVKCGQASFNFVLNPTRFVIVKHISFVFFVLCWNMNCNTMDEKIV